MSEYIHKSHNVTVLLYHLVFPAKYRRVVFDEQVDTVLKEVCLEIERPLPAEVSGDRHRCRSCSFSGAIGSDICSH